MLKASRAAIDTRLPSDALVLDVGGGASPLSRADWVLDLMGYAERGRYGVEVDPAGERYDATRWVQRDMCARDPWPFSDGQFDFAVCSHTLEDVRDPIWVCSELVRVARAGYIEVPSRLEEQSYGFQGPWAGWGHHRWLIDLDPEVAGLIFVAKHHVLHNRPGQHFPSGHQQELSAEERVLVLWWEGEFRFRERIFWDGPGLDAYLEAPVRQRSGVATAGRSSVSRSPPGEALRKDWLKRLKPHRRAVDR